jgi:hypothetical protein
LRLEGLLMGLLWRHRLYIIWGLSVMTPLLGYKFYWFLLVVRLSFFLPSLLP